jgi:hypothetical protein
VVEGGFRPKVTELGQRHPVTEGLEKFAPAPASEDGEPGWGRWFRAVEVEVTGGQVVMEGPQGLPLLVLDRVDFGRIAVLASDQAWLWGRGYEGGGPQLELLRRLAHWMLKEPELEEETLTAAVSGDVLTITRRTIREEAPGPVTVTAPDGTQVVLPMAQLAPGKFEVEWKAPALGLYRLEQEDLTRVIAVGPAAPREFVATIADGSLLAPVVAAARGAVLRVEDGLPDLRAVAADRPAAGRGWIGITPREAYVTADVQMAALLPGWAWALIAAALSVAAWLIEGRKGTKRA